MRCMTSLLLVTHNDVNFIINLSCFGSKCFELYKKKQLNLINHNLTTVFISSYIYFEFKRNLSIFKMMCFGILSFLYTNAYSI